ncbi:hypothetical protein QQ045_015601 [Rhodiola kirilowii]
MARDGAGVIVAVRAKHLSNVTSIRDCEGKAFQLGMQLAHYLQMDKVVFESDSTELVKSINCRINSCCWNCEWYQYCTSCMSKNSNWRTFFSTGDRQMNQPTH